MTGFRCAYTSGPAKGRGFLPDFGVVLPGVGLAAVTKPSREVDPDTLFSSVANISPSSLINLLRFPVDRALTGDDFRAVGVDGPAMGLAAALADLVRAGEAGFGSKAYLASLSAKALDAGLSIALGQSYWTARMSISSRLLRVDTSAISPRCEAWRQARQVAETGMHVTDAIFATRPTSAVTDINPVASGPVCVDNRGEAPRR